MKFCVLQVMLFTNMFACTTPQQTRQENAEPQLTIIKGRQAEAYIDRLHRIQGEGSWQRYTLLRYAGEDSPESLFETSNNELEAVMPTVDGQMYTFFFIPKVMYMNKGLPEQYAHRIEVFEKAGLTTQLYLHILEQAFPGGPQEIAGTDSKHVSQSEAFTLHLLAGSTTIQPPWTAEVSVERTSSTDVAFTVELTVNPQVKPTRPGIIRGVWSNEPRDWVLDDATRLEGWLVNYLLLRSWQNGRPESSAPVIGETASFKTVGDIRRAAKQMPKILE